MTNTSAKPSPLPWKVREETDHHPTYVVDDLGREVAAIFGDTREQRAANCSLIVRSVNACRGSRVGCEKL
jgi:hypothetical protein